MCPLQSLNDPNVDEGLKLWVSGKVKTRVGTHRDDHPNNWLEGHHLQLLSAEGLE